MLIACKQTTILSTKQLPDNVMFLPWRTPLKHVLLPLLNHKSPKGISKPSSTKQTGKSNVSWCCGDSTFNTRLFNYRWNEKRNTPAQTKHGTFLLSHQVSNQAYSSQYIRWSDKGHPSKLDLIIDITLSYSSEIYRQWICLHPLNL